MAEAERSWPALKDSEVHPSLRDFCALSQALRGTSMPEKRGEGAAKSLISLNPIRLSAGLRNKG